MFARIAARRVTRKPSISGNDGGCWQRAARSGSVIEIWRRNRHQRSNGGIAK